MSEFTQPETEFIPMQQQPPRVENPITEQGYTFSREDAMRIQQDALHNVRRELKEMQK